MPVTHSRELLGRTDPCPVAAFNVITVEHAEGIAAGAEHAGLPVILQLSENAIRYHGSPDAIAAAMHAVARCSTAQVALHLDHVTDLALLHRAPDLGFGSVMYDGSTLDIDDNLARTRDVAAWGTERDIWVEAELGEIGGKDGAHAPGVRTDPDDARSFVERTGVDALAVAVGSSHAMTEKSASLDLELIERLRDAVPAPLVLHGSSGVPDDLLTDAARRGMTKINIGTALNSAYTDAVRAALASYDGVDPRRYQAKARDAVADVVARYLKFVAG